MGCGVEAPTERAGVAALSRKGKLMDMLPSRERLNCTCVRLDPQWTACERARHLQACLSLRSLPGTSRFDSGKD